MPRHAKQLALNVFASYGVGEADVFGHGAGREVRFVRMDAETEEGGQGRVSSVVVDGELVVDKGLFAGHLQRGRALIVDDSGSDAERRWDVARRVSRLSYRQVNCLTGSPTRLL